MDPSLSTLFVQEVVPIVAVLLAGAWLVRRWTRPNNVGHSACASCEHGPAPQVARHRLTVLR